MNPTDSYRRLAGAMSPVPTVTSTELEVTKRSDGKWAAQLSSTLFPGAYGVDQVRWQSLNLDTATTLELGYSREAGDPVMSEAAHARYSSFQTMTVVVDSTDLQGSVGDALTLDLNVLHMPGIGAIQDLVDDPSVKNYAFDTMVKGAIPVLVGVHVTMEYVQGITPPEALPGSSSTTPPRQPSPTRCGI